MQNIQMPQEILQDAQATQPLAPQEGDLGMTQEEMRASLQDLMEIVQEKYRELDSKRFAYNNTKDTARKKALVVALKALQSAGVDVNDPVSVQQFADMLQQTNPEAYALFEEAFNALLGDEFQPPEPVPEVAPFSEEGMVGNEGMSQEVPIDMSQQIPQQSVPSQVVQ